MILGIRKIKGKWFISWPWKISSCRVFFLRVLAFSFIFWAFRFESWALSWFRSFSRTEYKQKYFFDKTALFLDLLVELLVFPDQEVKILKVLIHFLLDIIHFKLAKAGLPPGLKPTIIKKLLMIFLRKFLERQLHFFYRPVNILTQLHVLTRVDTGLFKVAESLDL